jgi:hypothetical protein
MLNLWKPILIHCAAANFWDGRHCLFKTAGTFEFAVQLALLSRIVLFRCEGIVVWAITVHLYKKRASFRNAVFKTLGGGHS